MGSFDKFLKGLGKQEERTTSEIKVEKNPVLEELVEIYAGWLEEKIKLGCGNAYQLCLTKTKPLVYTSKDISGLCLRLNKYEHQKQFEWSGLFLSVLINNCKDEEFLLLTDHLDKQINCIGYENTKKIVVQGNTKNYTGDSMSDGSIEVKGNTKKYTGYLMSGGSITVKGNTQDNTGFRMSGGSIEVQGNTGQYTGSCMTDGIIKITGTIKQIAPDWQGGKIYEKDKIVNESL